MKDAMKDFISELVSAVGRKFYDEDIAYEIIGDNCIEIFFTYYAGHFRFNSENITFLHLDRGVEYIEYSDPEMMDKIVKIALDATDAVYRDIYTK